MGSVLARTNEGRDEPVPHASSGPGDLATRIRQDLDPAVGSRTHDPSTPPVDRTGLRHRQAANLLTSGFAFRPSAVHQPRARTSREGREALPLSRARDVLPAPPLGGAPRLRPFARCTPRGRDRVDLGDARSRTTSRSPPRGAGQLFWGFAPRRTISRMRADETRGLDALRDMTLSSQRPLRAVRLGIVRSVTGTPRRPSWRLDSLS